MSNIYERVDNGDGTYSQNSHLTGSDIIQQSDIQYRRQTTIQTHAAVNVLPGAWNAPTIWIDCNGYDKIAFTFLNDASVTSSGNVLWSNDGISQHGEEASIIPAGAANRKAGVTDIKARWAKLTITNGDTVAHTFNAWAYLKV